MTHRGRRIYACTHLRAYFYSDRCVLKLTDERALIRHFSISSLVPLRARAPASTFTYISLKRHRNKPLCALMHVFAVLLSADQLRGSIAFPLIYRVITYKTAFARNNKRRKSMVARRGFHCKKHVPDGRKRIRLYYCHGGGSGVLTYTLEKTLNLKWKLQRSLVFVTHVAVLRAISRVYLYAHDAPTHACISIKP